MYPTWDECKAQVDRFSGAVFKGFATRAEALAYMQGGVGVPAASASASASAPEQRGPPAGESRARPCTVDGSTVARRGARVC